MMKHRAGKFDGHTKRLGIIRLVYLEMAATMGSAIRRGKSLRDWKRNLIEWKNPEWNDLAVGLGLEPLELAPFGSVDPGTSPG